MKIFGDRTEQKHRIHQVKAMALSKTAINSAILFGGNFLNTFLSLIAIIFVSRKLGPTNFGILATFNAVMIALVGLTDFGLGTTSIKLISQYLNENKRKAYVVMKVIVALEVLTGVLVGVLGLIFSKNVASALGGQHLLFAVRMGFLAGIFATAGAFYGPFFVAYEQFIKNALVNLSGAVLRTGTVIVLFMMASLSLTHVIVAYTIVPIAFFFIGFTFIPKDFVLKTQREEQREALQEIFHFSKWIFLSYVATSIAGKLDVFLISRFNGSEAVGLYAAAQQLVTVMPMLIGAITTVLLPKVSKLRTQTEFKGYIKRVVLGVSFLCLALIPIALFGDILIKLIFGHRFLGAISAFKILFLGYLVALFVNPLSLILYALNKPRILTYGNYIQLVVSLGAYVILIPRFGSIGAALTFLIINIVGAVFSIYWIHREVSKLSV